MVLYFSKQERKNTVPKKMTKEMSNRGDINHTTWIRSAKNKRVWQDFWSEMNDKEQSIRSQLQDVLQSEYRYLCETASYILPGQVFVDDAPSLQSIFTPSICIQKGKYMTLHIIQETNQLESLKKNKYSRITDSIPLFLHALNHQSHAMYKKRIE